MAGVTRLVLDTNVWLDWLVFDEPTLAPLRVAHAAGRVEIVMDEACEAELARVLAYDLGKHTIGAEAQASCIARCREVTKRVGGLESAASADGATSVRAAADTDTAAARAASTTAAATAAIVLPRCSDPDDQKFLELALAANADILVTKDQALLDLSRRKLPFRIAAQQALGAL
jgi:predicted nucleic acid-binding protein